MGLSCWRNRDALHCIGAPRPAQRNGAGLVWPGAIDALMGLNPAPGGGFGAIPLKSACHTGAMRPPFGEKGTEVPPRAKAAVSIIV